MTDLRIHFRKNPLLSSGGNTKIDKNEIPTYNLSLLPHTLNSRKVNLCAFSTKECRDVCLNGVGRGKFNQVQEARSRKTEFFVQYRKAFISTLLSELARINSLYDKVLVRLNTFSDVNWEKEFNELGFSIENFENIINYEYTKNPNYITSKKKNQEFTFSYSGYNWDKCEDLLKNKQCNVAVVFEKHLPTDYKGFKVLNGVDSDVRLKEYDGIGNIIGLKLKGGKKVSKFVVEQ